MPAARLDLAIDQGAKFPMPVTWNDENGNPVNLTGWSARMMVRKTNGNGQIYADLTIADGDIVITPMSGQIDITMNKAKSAKIPAGNWYYDLQVTDSSGEPDYLLWGRFNVRASITP